LINLLSNAVKFTESGEVAIAIHLMRGSNTQIELGFSIKDTGIGISARQMQRLFQAFSQGDNSTTRQYGGTGLGLAICRQLVRLMGGEITVQSDPGQK